MEAQTIVIQIVHHHHLPHRHGQIQIMDHHRRLNHSAAYNQLQMMFG